MMKDDVVEVGELNMPIGAYRARAMLVTTHVKLANHHQERLFF